MNTGTTGAISGAIGAAVATAVLLSNQVMQGGAVAADLGEIDRVAIVNPVKIQGVPTADQMVRIPEGSPFVVPAGKAFVATGLGRSTGSGTLVWIRIDGLPVWFGSITSNAETTHSVPPGIVAAAGSTVEASGKAAMVLGYLVDA